MSNTSVNTQVKTKGNAQAGIQKFGRVLSGMVMPNIGAFIAWGLITALFIDTGWLPNKYLSALVGPMITYLLPLLIGYTGGKMFGGARGGVIGAITTMGVIVGTSVPMFLGAMIVGPLAGYIIKKVDNALEGKIPAGFEMLINNFSLGIIGMLLALLAYSGIGPVVAAGSDALGAGVNAIVKAGLLPLTSIFVEPAKVLFLNNAINHGVFSPLGIAQSKELGKSIFFMIETNPGPGLGILLAYWLFAKGTVKQSAPGAIIIHFLGGIHEIYFPYILMNPVLILAVIAGGASGVFTFGLLNAGLVAPPSPGSIFAELAMTPKGGYFATLAGIIVATAVSFVVAAYFVKRSADKFDDAELEEAKDKVKDLKGTVKSVVLNNVNKIIFACDAGMGSSAMGATTLRNKLRKAGLNIEVVHCSVDEVPSDAQLVVTHESLTERARLKAPRAEHVSIKNFMSAPEYDEIVKKLSK